MFPQFCEFEQGKEQCCKSAFSETWQRPFSESSLTRSYIASIIIADLATIDCHLITDF